MAQDYLCAGIAAIGFSGTPAETLQTKMEKYINELLLFNAAYDLVGANDRDTMIIRHILDSLAAAPEIAALVPEKSRPKGLNPALALSGCQPAAEEMVSTGTKTTFTAGDIGSGGGFPGIPLAAAFPDIQFILVERMSKRCAFLENCVALLDLKNVTVQNTQAEQLPQEQLDLAVFRAFRPLDKKMAKTLLRTVKTGGWLAAYKAKSENITAEMNAVQELIPVYNVRSLSVPFLPEHERNLVLIQKT